MPYNFAADSFHTKKLCSRLSSSEVRFYTKIGRIAFLRPSLGDLGPTYDDHFRLIGKRVVDFLLVLIELFSLGVTAEELRANIGWKSAISLQRGLVDPKFHVEGVAPHQLFFFSENYDKWSFVWYKNIAENFNRLSRVHERYRQTDRRQTTDGRTTTYSEREREFTFAKNRCEPAGILQLKVVC